MSCLVNVFYIAVHVVHEVCPGLDFRELAGRIGTGLLHETLVLRVRRSAHVCAIVAVRSQKLIDQGPFELGLKILDGGWVGTIRGIDAHSAQPNRSQAARGSRRSVYQDRRPDTKINHLAFGRRPGRFCVQSTGHSRGDLAD